MAPNITLRQHKYFYFSSNFCPVFLASISGFCLKQNPNPNPQVLLGPLLPSPVLSFSTTTLLGFPQLCGSGIAPTHLKSMHHCNLNTSVLPQPMHACTTVLASCTVTVYMRTWYRVAVKEQGAESPAVWVLVPKIQLRSVQSL